MTYEECFLCEKNTLNCLENVDFCNLNATVPGSKREVRFVLEHLANCIRTKLIIGSDTNICSNCYNELSDYDDLMVKLLSSQKRLTSRLQKILSWKNEEGDSENKGSEAPTWTLDNNDEQPMSMADVTKVEDEDCTSQGGEVALFEAKGRMQQECIACGETFKGKFLLHRHITETHKAKIFECNICGAVRKDEEYLELHMNIHEGKTEFECRYCPKRFSRPVNTLRHMRKHWDKKEYQCEKCGERFSLDNMLYNHRLIHEAEENPIICSICNQSFKSRKTYKHHQVTHQKHRPRHQCSLCPKSFTERYTLKMHMTNHSSNKDSEKSESNETLSSGTLAEKNSCLVCKRKFKSKEFLNAHLKKNHNVLLSFRNNI